MFTIKSLNNFLGSDNPLSQQGQEMLLSKDLVSNGEGPATKKENDDSVVIAGGTDAYEGHGEISSEPLKIEVKKGEDDDSTAAVSESSSSTHGHTEVLLNNAVISSPGGGDKKSHGKCSNDSDLTTSKLEDAQNLEVVADVELTEERDKEVEPDTIDKNVMSNESVVENLEADRGKEENRLVSEKTDIVIIQAEEQRLNEKNGEIKSKVIVSGTKEECTQNFNDEDEKKEDGKTNALSLTLAQRMKEMFDSSSPDRPSNAFGKGGTRSAVNLDPPKSTYLATDMKRMFESPSPDKPSRAFSVGKTSIETLKEDTASTTKPRCNTETSVKEVEANAEATKSISPTSVADQMVSMLWASSSSSKQSMTKKSGPTEQVVDTKVFLDSNHVVIRETVIEEGNDSDEDIEEITVEDENGNDVTLAHDQCFDEIIEEITVEDEAEIEDGISVATNEEFFKNKACIEVSPDLVAMVEKAECDECSYDEITADDSEFDEKTLDEGVSRDDNEKVFKPRKEGTPTISLQTVSVPTKIQQEKNHFDRSKVEKLNPRLAKNPSPAGKITERLKMFDSAKAVEGQQSLTVSKQTYQKSKPREESKKDSKKDDRLYPKTPTVLLPTLSSTTKHMDQSGEKTLDKSRSGLDDDALVEKIISLLKEPGAMENKHGLAERIASLLTGKRKDDMKTPTLIQPLHSATSKSYDSLRKNQLIDARSSLPPKIATPPSSDSKYVVESNSYLHRKNDKFMDPGLKQMRKDVKVQKEKPKHIEDPDTLENRRMKRITIMDKKEKTDETTKLKPGFVKKNVDPEEIMARIWPKTPRGEKSQAKAPSKSKTPDNCKTTPKKLGNRIKMFESPSSSTLSASETEGSLEKNVAIETQNELAMKKSSSNKVEVNGGRNQINEKTVRRLVIFQRIWRKRDSKRVSKNVFDRGDADPNTEGVFITAANSKNFNSGNVRIKPTASQINLGGDSFEASISTSDASKLPNSSDSNDGCSYSLEDFELGSFDRNVVVMERWEEFLSDESFYKHFGLTKVKFYQQPKWKRKNQKRKVRVAF